MANLGFSFQSNLENLSPQIYPQGEFGVFSNHFTLPNEIILLFLVLRLVSKQISDLVTDPPEGIRVLVNDEDISAFSAVIEGPGKVLILLVGLHILMCHVILPTQLVHLTSKELFT